MSDFACCTLKKVENLDFGGGGAFCCVPLCKSAFYDSQGKVSLLEDFYYKSQEVKEVGYWAY